MNTTELPDHLGGHLGKVHTDRATLLYLKQKYNIKTMIDVGCGPGDMTEIAAGRGIDAMGIDGDFTLSNTWKSKQINVKLHDFSTGAPDDLPDEFDLGWSVEFLEHVDAEYIPNFMSVFERCKYVVCTAAPPGHGGHHHVNEQPQKYWVDLFAEYGFEFDDAETTYIRHHSAMRKPFMQATGMFFKRA